jgi:hypothetical protein
MVCLESNNQVLSAWADYRPLARLGGLPKPFKGAISEVYMLAPLNLLNDAMQQGRSTIPVIHLGSTLQKPFPPVLQLAQSVD